MNTNKRNHQKQEAQNHKEKTEDELYRKQRGIYI
jgi:hypothetical protein